MVKIGLELKATLENVQAIRTCGKSFRWFIKLRCANCGEVSQKWHYVTLEMVAPLKGGRGHASMVEKCKMCARDNSIEVMEDRVQPYTEEDDGKGKVVVGFECRGMEPVEFDIRSGWEVESAASSKVFMDVDLKDKEWYEYDENAGESVSITEISYSFIKIKN